MAVITMTSASGSPGVTTTAVALAVSWPRPVVLIDADPTGGSAVLAGFSRGVREYESGLVEIALSPLDIGDALRYAVRPLGGSASFAAGTRSHSQAAALRDVWEPLATALAELGATGQDVIVDAGRLGLVGSPLPLLDSADLTVMVTQATLPALAAARSWAETVREPVTGWRRPGVLLVGAGRPYGPAEIASVLGMPVVADLPDDPDGAAVYHRGATAPKRFDTSAYVRAVSGTANALRDLVAAEDRQVTAEAVR